MSLFPATVPSSLPAQGDDNPLNTPPLVVGLLIIPPPGITR